MLQAIGLLIVAAGALIAWAGFTNAGGHRPDGTPIPTLGQTVGAVLRGGR